MAPNLETWQDIADWIADNLTAAALAELAVALDVRLAGSTRQEIANRLTGELAAAGRLMELQAYLSSIDDTFPFPPPGTLSDHTAQATPEPPAERVVNTGFAGALNPAVPSRPNIPLDTGADYYFWLDVGPPAADSIETEAIALDTADLPDEALLAVALYSYPGELILTPGADVGTLRVEASGDISVVTQPAGASGLPADLAGRRLFFPVRTPAAPGTYRLRAAIYYQQTLLQSRLVTAVVSEDPEPGPDAALTAEVDFILARRFDPGRLAPLPAQKLSILLNDNAKGTHGLRFFGEGEFKNDATLEPGELQDLIGLMRGALRQAAWGDEAEYEPGKAYRYDGPADLKRLRIDLLRLAIRGYRLFDVLIDRLAGGRDAVDRLLELLRRPGHLQMAAKRDARLIVPVAMIYDHWLDTGLKASEYRICPEFESWLEAGRPLLDCPCFQGNCPSYGEDDIVCPSGFWGFRHALGLPVTLTHGAEPPVLLPVGDAPELAIAVSTDPQFTGREAHERVLRGLHPFLQVYYAAERAETIELLRRTSPHVFYFFCHGRVAAGTPSLEVGPPGTRGISRDNLRAKRVRWEEVRPLVFLNGCHTAALAPEKAIDLVSGFIDTAQATGVIGTEIVNFVPLARTFAEETLRRFYAGEPIGEAVRAGRLAVLQQGNPLGLIFIPFVMSGLRLAPG